MAKGLGAIMAQVELDSRRARIKRGETVICPLCGQEMEYNGAAWFCRSYRDDRGEHRACIVNDTRIWRAFCNPDEGRWADDWQRGTVLAAILGDDGRPVVVLDVVRGRNGYDALRVTEWGYDHQLDVAAIVRDGQWVWQDWVPDECIGVAR